MPPPILEKKPERDRRERIRRRFIFPGPKLPRSYPSTVLGIWRFDGTLEDEVGQNNLSPVSIDGSTTFTSFDKFELLTSTVQTRKGLTFVKGEAYAVSPNYNYNSDFTIAFWWFSPGLVGFTRHVTTREQEPKVAPIIAKADLQSLTDQVKIKNSSFVIAEIGASKTQNAIRVYLTNNGSDISHIATSEYYAPGLIHVLVTYIQSQGRVRIDINGKTGILHTAPTGSLEQIGALRINQYVPGFVSHQTSQEGGYLFDLVFTSYASLDNESLKMMRYGYEYITENELFDTRFMYFGLSYPQPTTISTTNLFVDGGSVFATRSNGEIVKGERALWDKEFNYLNPSDVSLLTTSKTDDDRIAEWSTNGLRLKGVSVRI